MIRIASKIVEVEVFNTFHEMFCRCALPMSLVVHPEEFDLIKYLIIKHVWKYLRVTSSWFMNPHFCQPWHYREGTSSWRCIIGYKLHTMTKLKWWAILYNSCIKYFKAFTIINVKKSRLNHTRTSKRQKWCNVLVLGMKSTNKYTHIKI